MEEFANSRIQNSTLQPNFNQTGSTKLNTQLPTNKDPTAILTDDSTRNISIKINKDDDYKADLSSSQKFIRTLTDAWDCEPFLPLNAINPTNTRFVSAKLTNDIFN